MQPQVGLQFLIEGAGSFQNANVVVSEKEALRVVKEWSSGLKRSGTLVGENGTWAVLMDNVRGVFIFSLQPPAGGQAAVLPPSRSPFSVWQSGN